MKLKKLAACALSLSLSLSALSAVPVFAAESDPEPFTIGFPWDTANTDPTWISIYNNVEAAVESAGGELVSVNTDNTADDLINKVSELISRGVDGILHAPFR